MDSDLTFITNQPGHNLKERFEVLIKDSQFFDCLVGYFYTSGFYAIYKSLKETEKIRILIGIGTTRETYDLLESTLNKEQQALEFSHAEAKEKIANMVEKEMKDSEDNKRVEEGGIPKQTTKKTLRALQQLNLDLTNPLKVLAVVQNNIPQRFLESHYAEHSGRFSGKREVILSLYLAGGKKNENS